jgi:hypothetical protein
LSGNGVSYCGSNISTVVFIFVNFKNDFAHEEMLFCSVIPSKSGRIITHLDEPYRHHSRQRTRARARERDARKRR